MDFAINAAGHEKNIVGGINVNDKHYLKKKMELLSKLASKDTS